MRLDNLALAYHLLELRPLLENAFVNRVSELKKGFVKIRLHTKQGGKDLILAPDALFISQYLLRARHGKSNFARSLKTELYNKRIIGIGQHEFDRVVTIKFLEHSLVLEFLGEGNKVLVGKDGKIISCERNEEWSDRKTRKGEKYVYPKPKGVSPLLVSLEQLEKRFGSSGKDAIRALIAGVNASPLVCEEVFARAGIGKNKAASEIARAELEKIRGLLKGLYSVSGKKLRPVSYGDFPYPFELRHLSNAKRIPSLNSFIDEALVEPISKAESPVAGKRRQDSVSRLEFHAKQQAEAREKFSAEAEENRKKAELLYRYYSGLEELRIVIRDAVKRGYTEKEIMYKMGFAAEKGNVAAKLLKSVSLAGKKFTAELD